MKKLLLIILGLLLITAIAPAGCTPKQAEELGIFAGAASKPALEEAGQAFEAKTGIKAYFNFGGSGDVLSQMKLAKSGDLYIPGSPDYIAIAKRHGAIEPESVKIISYLVPVIAVQKGNPKNIKSLADLAKPGISVGMGNPQAVCLGLYGVEILEYNNLLDEVGENIVTQSESCSKTASLVAMKSVDAVIGWHVFHDWNPDKIDVVYLEPEQTPRLAYIPAAISSYTYNKDNTRQFIDFLLSEDGQRIFSKWGYIASEEEVRKFAPEAQIGGEYTLPDDYKSLSK